MVGQRLQFQCGYLVVLAAVVHGASTVDCNVHWWFLLVLWLYSFQVVDAGLLAGLATVVD